MYLFLTPLTACSALPADTLAALQEFYDEKESRESKFQKLQSKSEEQGSISMDMFAEDWNASQFWVGTWSGISSQRHLTHPVQ